MRVSRRRALLLSLGCGLLAACQAAAPAVPTVGSAPTPKLADSAWQALVQSAQAEKTVVLRGPPTAAVRTDMTSHFTQVLPK